MKIAQHDKEIAVRISNRLEVGMRERELDEGVVQKVFGALLIVLRQL